MANEVKSFFHDFITSLWSTVLATFAICASVAGIWPNFIKQEEVFSQRYFLSLLMGFIILAGVLVEVARRQRRYANLIADKRDTALQDLAASREQLANASRDTKVTNAIQMGDQTLILVSPSAAFGTDTAVVVYQRDRDFEIEIGVGRANRFQGTGDRVQVVIVDHRGRDELWTRICTGEEALLSSLVVRNALPFDVYQRLARHD